MFLELTIRILIMPGFSSISRIPAKIHVKKVVGLHLNTGTRKKIGAVIKRQNVSGSSIRDFFFVPFLISKTVRDIWKYEFEGKNGLGLISR
jgi:hypothetical protein